MKRICTRLRLALAAVPFVLAAAVQAQAAPAGRTLPVFTVGSPDAAKRISILYSPSCPDCFLAFRNAVANLIDGPVRRGEVHLTAYLMPRQSSDIRLGLALTCVPAGRHGPLVIEYMNRKSLGRQMGDAELLRLVKRYGAPVDSLDKCIDEDRESALVQVNREGIALGVSDTPGWLIDGKLHQGIYFYWQLKPLLGQ